MRAIKSESDSPNKQKNTNLNQRETSTEAAKIKSGLKHANYIRIENLEIYFLYSVGKNFLWKQLLQMIWMRYSKKYGIFREQKYIYFHIIYT